MKKMLIISFLILVMLSFSAFAGIYAGVVTTVTELNVNSYKEEFDGVYCFDLDENPKGYVSCLTEEEIVLTENGELSKASKDLLKQRVEIAIQTKMLNEARTEVSKIECVKDSDCSSSVLTANNETFVCVKSQCKESAYVNDKDVALDKIVGKKI